MIGLKNAFEKAEKEFNTSKSLLDQEEGKYKSKKQAKEKTEEELNNAIRLFNEKVIELKTKKEHVFKALLSYNSNDKETIYAFSLCI